MAAASVIGRISPQSLLGSDLASLAASRLPHPHSSLRAPHFWRSSLPSPALTPSILSLPRLTLARLALTHPSHPLIPPPPIIPQPLKTDPSSFFVRHRLAWPFSAWHSSPSPHPSVLLTHHCSQITPPHSWHAPPTVRPRRPHNLPLLTRLSSLCYLHDWSLHSLPSRFPSIAPKRIQIPPSFTLTACPPSPFPLLQHDEPFTSLTSHLA